MYRCAASSWPPSYARACDTLVSRHSFEKYLYATNNQLLYLANTGLELSFLKSNKIGFGWRGSIHIKCKGSHIQAKRTSPVNALATVEPASAIPREIPEFNTNISSSHDSELHQSQYLNGEPPIDDRERLRRMRISIANKGNTPWNKGRKHSPETVQLIRERTRIAMQDPKVKQKLLHFGHAQSKETRIKIGLALRLTHMQRREKLMVQETCFLEWRDMIADAARKGFAGGVELQWDSYKILEEQLQQEFLESMERRKSMPKPRGNRRAPKSAEQRKKIAEAIAAKWLDPEYRERVCSGIAKHHGTTAQANDKRTPKPAQKPVVGRGSVKKEPSRPTVVGVETKFGSELAKRKKSVTPYKDPMAEEKLEMITKIKAQRAVLETESKEVIKRARLLIAEAEKAANALEIAALTSPFAQASLLETRRLVGEAKMSLKGVVDEQLTTQSTSDDISFDSTRLDLHNSTMENENSLIASGNKPINGVRHPPDNSNGREFYFNASALNGRALFRVSESIENSIERAYVLPSPSVTSESMSKGIEATDFRRSRLMVDESVRHGEIMTGRREDVASETQKNEVPSPATKTKMKWVRGRLVEVGED